MDYKSIRFVIAVAAVVALPLRAYAGGTVTAHPLSLSMKVVAQTTASNGDDRFGKVTVGMKDVFQECEGAPPTKSQGIYLFIDCFNFNNNSISAIETAPFLGIEEIGDVTFTLGRAIRNESKGVLKQELIPAVVHLTCNGGGTDITLNGVFDLKFASDACPNSGKFTLSGDGMTPSSPSDFVVNKNSTINVKPRSSTISGFPIFP